MPQQLLRDGEVIQDRWVRLAEGGGESAAGLPLLLSFDQWLAERDRWVARGGDLGVSLAPANRVELLARDLAQLSLIAVDFPGPAEGRGYSQGRLLRERWNYRGELRATGHVRRDQLFFLARCGFNSFEMPDTEIAAAGAALATFSAAYQPANDAGLASILRTRESPSPV
jgi:uncharacterized protein (DUF934 family)